MAVFFSFSILLMYPTEIYKIIYYAPVRVTFQLLSYRIPQSVFMIVEYSNLLASFFFQKEFTSQTTWRGGG